MSALPGPVGAAGLDLNWLMQVFEGYNFDVEQQHPTFFSVRDRRTRYRVGLDDEDHVVHLIQAWRLSRQKSPVEIRRAVETVDSRASLNRFFISEEDWNLIAEAKFFFAGKVVRASDIKSFFDRADEEFMSLAFRSGLYEMFAPDGAHNEITKLTHDMPVPPHRPFYRGIVVMSVVTVMLAMIGAATIALGLGGWLGQPGITTERISTPEDNPFMPPVDDRTEVTMPARSDGTFGSSTPQSPSTPQALTTQNPAAPAVPTQAPMSPPPEQRPVELRPLQRPADHPPVITGISTYQEDPLVYFSLRFTDPDGDAEGFGFRGVNGAGWAEENIPFTSPSYGRVSPGRVDYPFNHGCGQDNEYESDVEAWIYDSEGNRSESIIVHLSCS